MSVVKSLYRDLTEFVIELKDWQILDTGVTALWGPSGAGKSTVVHSLLGLDSHAKVHWEWQGERMDLMTPQQRNLGIVFQDPGLFPHMSVKENILFPVTPDRNPHWSQDYEFLIDQLELKNLERSQCRQISGGEAQRVALARAVIYRPRMIILDEPFSSLDFELRKQSRSMIKGVQERLRCPVLLITHDPADIDDLASKISYLEKGKITKEETLKG